MGRKTENIDRYECKEKMIPGAWKSRTGFGRDNTGVSMGETSAAAGGRACPCAVSVKQSAGAGPGGAGHHL